MLLLRWRKLPFLLTPAFIFCLLWGRPCGNHANRCNNNEKTIQCLPKHSHHVPIYLRQFPSYSNRNCEKSPFSRIAAHIFVSPGDAPVLITQYIAWIERKFYACQTPRSMYLSIFNSFRVIRYTSVRKSKNRYFHVPQPTLLFPIETPLRLSRDMLHGWKDNSMLAKPLAACTYLSSTVSELYDALKSMRKSKNRYFYPFFVSTGDAPGAITLNVVWMEREFDA